MVNTPTNVKELYKLTLAILELAKDAVVYVPDYFDQKWHMNADLMDLEMHLWELVGKPAEPDL